MPIGSSGNAQQWQYSEGAMMEKHLHFVLLTVRYNSMPGMLQSQWATYRRDHVDTKLLFRKIRGTTAPYV